MNFTPKFNVGSVAIAILAIGAAIGLAGRVAPAPAPCVSMQDSAQEFSQADTALPIVHTAEFAPGPGLQSDMPAYYQPISSWYKRKGWWKRNAPIIGGAGGGALIGGLVGGGTGALIGGAAGAGGGYLYKRSRHRHHRRY
jgi:hypothetical protein